jgi:hypothetical protein
MMNTTNWHMHRLALEHWRDAYVKYIGSDYSDCERLYSEVSEHTAAAANALEAAHCSVAAQNDEGTMEYGLERVLPIIMRKHRDMLDQARKSERVRTVVITGDKENAPQSPLEALLVTVEYAIGDLEEFEAKVQEEI